MIDGVAIFDIKRNEDDRGYFAEVMREDCRKLLGQDRIVQFSLSSSNPNVIRAWHRHVRGQNDYLICISGAIKACIYDDRRGSMTKGELDEIVVNSEEKLQVIRIVGACWHGYKVISPEPALILYGVTRLYNYHNPDEKRRPWDDKKVVPASINGKSSNSRVGRPYDWNAHPDW